MALNVPFALVDAFTQQPFTGNTAGVVTAADELSGEQMQRIAGELRQTETCFVSASSEPATDFALRWFTPRVEVDLCGHATVGAFVVLAADGRIAWRDGQAHVRCATRTGAIDVWLERGANGSPTVMLSVGVATITPAPDEPADVARAVGLRESALNASLPLATEPAGTRLIVPVARLADLLAMTPNGSGMVEYGARRGYRRFTLLCRETANPECFVHLRHFAPANGILEDPVTGTAHAVAAVYLDQQGLLTSGEVTGGGMVSIHADSRSPTSALTPNPLSLCAGRGGFGAPSGRHMATPSLVSPGGRVVLLGEQGQAVERPGLVTVEVLRHEGCVTDVRIGGSGTIVARGMMQPPP